MQERFINMGLSRLEQEVVINFNAEENTASIYTANPTWVRKMDKLVEKNPDEFRLVGEETMDGEVVSKVYECPKKYISVRSGTRVMSKEQREANAERLRRMRNKRSYSLPDEGLTTSNHSEDS